MTYFLHLVMCADDTRPFACDQNIENVLAKLENNAEIAMSCFEYNYMKMNNDIREKA